MQLVLSGMFRQARPETALIVALSPPTQSDLFISSAFDVLLRLLAWSKKSPPILGLGYLDHAARR